MPGPTYTTANPKFIAPSEAAYYSQQGYTLKPAPGYNKGSGGYQVTGSPSGGGGDSSPSGGENQGGSNQGGGGGGSNQGARSAGPFGGRRYLDYLKAKSALHPKPPEKPEVFTHEVQPEETVQGQLYSLLRSDSPYIQEARARAVREANKRGLQNSTLAAQSGEVAAIQSALPIAAQDAETYSRQALANQEVQNRAELVAFQEAHADWRTVQNIELGLANIELGVYEVETGYAISNNQIAAQMAQQAFIAEQNTRNWYLDQLSMLNNQGITSGPQYEQIVRNLQGIRDTELAWTRNLADGYLV